MRRNVSANTLQGPVAKGFSVSVYIYIYIFIYVFIYREREREREGETGRGAGKEGRLKSVWLRGSEKVLVEYSMYRKEVCCRTLKLYTIVRVVCYRVLW